MSPKNKNTFLPDHSTIVTPRKLKLLNILSVQFSSVAAPTKLYAFLVGYSVFQTRIHTAPALNLVVRAFYLELMTVQEDLTPSPPHPPTPWLIHLFVEHIHF